MLSPKGFLELTILFKNPNINGFLKEKIVEGLTIKETEKALEEAMKNNSIPKKEILIGFSLNSDLNENIKSASSVFANYLVSACKTEFKYLNNK